MDFLLPVPRWMISALSFSLHACRSTSALFAVWLLTFCTVSYGQTVSGVQYSQGDPTASEQYLLQKLNAARMDPTGEGQRLAAWLRNTSDGQGVVGYFGTNPDQIAAAFAALPAVPPLAFHPDLIAAARSHSNDLAPHDGNGPNGDGHAGYDGSSPDSRVYASGFRAVGDQDGFAEENFSPGASSLYASHASFLIDWGVASLGHRQNAMNGSYAINFVGIGLVTKPAGVNATFPFVNTNDFGYPGLSVNNTGLHNQDVPAMLTGVAYRDTDGNGQYDVGEGVAGIVVTVDGGAYYAVTSASGGYSLPLVNSDGSNANGNVTVRMKGFPEGDHVATVAIKTVPTQYGFYRANVEWDGVAGQLVSVVPPPALASFFGGASALGQQWYYLSFTDGNVFGYFNASTYPYLYHADLGYEYVFDANDGHNGVYLYDFKNGTFFYTSPTFPFPYLYDFSLNSTVYYYPNPSSSGHYNTNGVRYFYVFTTGQIISK